MFCSCLNIRKILQEGRKSDKTATEKKNILTGYRFAAAPFHKENFITVRRNARSRNKNSENWTLLIEKQVFFVEKGELL